MSKGPKINGDDLKALGWTPGPVFRPALRAAKRALRRGVAREEVLAALDQLRKKPKAWVEDPDFGACAQAMLEVTAEQEFTPSCRLRDVPIEWRTWGCEAIDADAIRQLENACRLPITAAAALMPDAHVGYGVPIGGVVATRGAVIPYAVGVDIACRMRLSVMDEPPEVITGHRDSLRRALRQETAFGIGASFPKRRRREHAVLEDPGWKSIETPNRDRLFNVAWEQLGTSGSGNHFVEFGEIEIHQPVGDLRPGRHLALLSHSGSRGFGSKVADHFTRVAMATCPLPKELRHLAWLSLDTAAGQAYWEAMNLAGRYAQANHECIHHHVLRTAGLEAAFSIENHHNFAWVEEHRGEEMIVHRKGATPAGEGALGIIPGTMGDPGFLVRGKGNAESLNSSAHGAGRRMSRRAAKQTITHEAWQERLAGAQVELMAGGLDEAPQAYKPIREVMAAQEDLVEILATFHPRLVLMSAEKRKMDI
jgi:tRNA-splicing ligase RtcB